MSSGEQISFWLEGSEAAAPGRVTATVRVLHSAEDFGAMQPGDALVA